MFFFYSSLCWKNSSNEIGISLNKLSDKVCNKQNNPWTGHYNECPLSLSLFYFEKESKKTDEADKGETRSMAVSIILKYNA